MAFRTNRSHPTLDQVYYEVRDYYAMIRAKAVELRALTASPVDALTLLEYVDDMANLRLRTDARIALVGSAALAAYALTVENNAGAYNAVSQYTAARTALLDAIGSVVTAWPSSGGPLVGLAANGQRTVTTFPTTSFSTIQTGNTDTINNLLDAFIAAVEPPA